MSRVEINFPEVTHFSTELSVRIGDVNQANHLGHDRMITMIHEARIQFFKALGYEEIANKIQDITARIEQQLF